MQVGCLGDISFEVSGRRIKTIQNFNLSGSASYAKHQRVGSKELPEYTGENLDTAEIEMIISAYLGASPRRELKKISRAKKAGTAMPLVIGDDYYGRYVITAYQLTAINYDRDMGVSAFTVKFSLMEYV